ncbi:MAG: DegT/DnrJ/EryC1/StrS family aminotransferase [Gemmatimonadaceae bacterium]
MVTGELTRFTYFRGRVALAAILRALGVRAGDEVLLQAFTCVAVPEAILSIGARPVYVDIRSGCVNMDPTDLLRRIGHSPKALVVQHSFGLPADVRQLGEIARAHGIPLIEDCAHTISSRVDGRFVGSFGDAAFYSYEAAKPVFVGIGGSAVSNDEQLTQTLAADYALYENPPAVAQLETAAMFHAHRIAYRPGTYWPLRSLFRTLSFAGVIRGNYNEVAGRPAADFGRRMGTLQQRSLRRELSTLDAQSAHRRFVAGEYRTRIHADGIKHLPVAPNAEPVFGRYPLLAENRPELIERARDAKVEIAVFYETPVHPLNGNALRTVGYEPGSCPNAEWTAARIISLPTGARVGIRQIRRTVEFLNGTQGAATA